MQGLFTQDEDPKELIPRRTIKVIRDQFQRDLAVVINQLNDQITEFDDGHAKDLNEIHSVSTLNSDMESSDSDIEELNLFTTHGSASRTSAANGSHASRQSPANRAAPNKKSTSKTVSPAFNLYVFVSK